MKLIHLLRRIRSRIDDWIERLERRQPRSAPCDDPIMAREMERLSREILAHYSTTNPYLFDESRPDMKYWIRDYQCPECGEFTVIHNHEPLQTHCECGLKVRYLRTTKEGETNRDSSQSLQ